MEKLPDCFKIEKFGLDVRLVNVQDADFILSLRTNKHLARYLHPTDGDKDKQIEWILQYKMREQDGREYYFIYFKDGKPVGVNRIYNIYDHYGTIGSWICSPQNDPEVSMATYFLMFDMFFYDIQLDLCVFEVQKANKQVIKLHRKVGALIVGETDDYLFFTLNKVDYVSNREQMIHLFNL